MSNVCNGCGRSVPLLMNNRCNFCQTGSVSDCSHDTIVCNGGNLVCRDCGKLQ